MAQPLSMLPPDTTRFLEEQQRRRALFQREGLLGPQTPGDLAGMGNQSPAAAGPPSRVSPLDNPAGPPSAFDAKQYVSGLYAAPQREAAAPPRGGLLGTLDKGYAAVDGLLPADGLLDPMFNGGRQGGDEGGLLGKVGGLLGSGLRVGDKVLGLGVGGAIDSERARTKNAEVMENIRRIGTDGSLAPAQKLAAMKELVQRESAGGADMSRWHAALEEAQKKLDRDAYIATLPPELQARAKIDLDGEVTEQRTRTRPQIFASDAPITMVEPGRIGEDGLPGVRQLSPGVTKPSEMTTDKVTAGVLSRWQRGEEVSERDLKIVNRYLEGVGGGDGPLMTMDRLTAQAWQKAMELGDINRLPSVDRQLIEEYLSRGGSDLMQLLLGGGLGGLGGGEGGGSGRGGGGNSGGQNDPYPGIADGAYVTQNGQRYQRRGNEMVPVN